MKRKNETLEREYRVDIEKKQPNFKDGRKYRETVAFLNNWFDRRWKVYVEDNRLVRDQTLDRYLCKQKACQNVVETMFPKNRGKTLILYGKGCEFILPSERLREIFSQLFTREIKDGTSYRYENGR